MASTPPALSVLLVDDEAELRQSVGQALASRGLEVREAASGPQALEAISHERPSVVVLDLKMPGMDGITTLQRIRQSDPVLPVVILAGHGDLRSALTGVKEGIADLLTKPVDVERLALLVHRIGEQGPAATVLREPTITELMTPLELYPRLFADQPVVEAIQVISRQLAADRPPSAGSGGPRSALVFDREETFLGLLRFHDLLRLMLPRLASESPYPTFVSGMLLAQCKVVGSLDVGGAMARPITVDGRAPLMLAVELMVKHGLAELAVTDEGGRVVGVLRDSSVLREMAREAGSGS